MCDTESDFIPREYFELVLEAKRARDELDKASGRLEDIKDSIKRDAKLLSDRVGRNIRKKIFVVPHGSVLVTYECEGKISVDAFDSDGGLI